jgi:hypothetical protein
MTQATTFRLAERLAELEATFAQCQRVYVEAGKVLRRYGTTNSTKTSVSRPSRNTPSPTAATCPASVHTSSSRRPSSRTC